MAVSKLVAFVALAFCFVAGYLLAGWWWSSARDTSPLAQICARVDYVNGLQETLKDSASVEVQTEIKELYRVPEILTRGRLPDGGESDSTWRTQEARHVGSDTIAPGF